MPTFSFKFYDGTPASFGITVAATGSSVTYTGPSIPTGDIDITDNGAGFEGQTLGEVDSATADATIGGLTSIGSPVSNTTGFFVFDTVTNDIFTIIELVILTGDAAGNYTLSEMPLVTGRDYVIFNSDTSPNGFGVTSFTYANYVCFATGTLIETPDGPRLVEALRQGDYVTTLNHGPQRILWRGHRRLRFGPDNAGQKPVLLARDSLGAGCPARDLVLSPQHRILLTRDAADTGPGADEFLGLAKALTARPGIRVMRGKQDVTYHTLMTTQHDIIFANGLAVETFYPGPQGMSVLTMSERRGISAALHGAGLLDSTAYGPPARPILTRRAIDQLGPVAGQARRQFETA